MKRIVVLFLLAMLLGSCAGAGNMPGLSPLAVELGGINGQAVDFGVLPGVYSDRTPETISITAWVKAGAGFTVGEILMFTSNAGGLRFGAQESAGLLVPSVYSNVFNSAPGGWTAVAPAMDTSWHLFVMTFNISATTNDPLFYVDGSALGTIETLTPAGSKYPKSGVPIVIGNHKSSTENYDQPWKGQLFDVRVYNRVITQDDVTGIFNSGTPSMSAGTKSGLVFQPFAVRTEKLADYTDANLSGLKLFDAQYLAVGEVIGSVTGRTAP